MSAFDESEIADAPPEERESLIALAARLEHERPVCAPGFRGELRRSLLGTAQSRSSRPERLRGLILAYAGSGAVMLLIAALGVGGIGPLAAG